MRFVHQLRMAAGAVVLAAGAGLAAPTTALAVTGECPFDIGAREIVWANDVTATAGEEFVGEIAQVATQAPFPLGEPSGWFVAWGDGSDEDFIANDQEPPEGHRDLIGTHTYAEPGAYELTVAAHFGQIDDIDVECWSTALATVLDVPPITSAAVSPPVPDGDNGWYVSPVHVTLSASHPSGAVAETRCVLDPTIVPSSFAELPLSCPYVGDGAWVRADGAHTVYFASASVSGEAEQVRGATFNVDATTPDVSCEEPDGRWHPDDVTVACATSDATSGLLDPTKLRILLTTNVDAGMETADAATGSAHVCDQAGNCAKAGPVSGNMIDRKPPEITLETPADGARYSLLAILLRGSPRADYSCADHGSGLAGCAGTKPDGARLHIGLLALGRHTFTVTATDQVGNTASATHTYWVLLP